MSRATDILGPFSLRRISGQIAALVFGSLVVIHLLIAGYFLLNQPGLILDNPLQQFELTARIIADTPHSQRTLVLENVDRAFPELKFRLWQRGEFTAGPNDGPRTKIRVPLAGRVELLRGASPEANRVLYYLTDGDVLEATIGSFQMPAFVSGLWTSTLLFLVASVTLLGIWAGRALSLPLSAFARAAESFSIGRSSTPLPENGPDEIRAAARALNRMRDRITSLMNDRNRMLAAISHDLRTPITRLKLRSEYIADHSQRVQTLRDLDQMQSMLESVLTLLRNESSVKPTLVDIAALLQMICEQFSDCGYTVSYSGPERATCIVRPDEITRAITNLVENGVRYGTAVHVQLSMSTDRAIIEVSDNGPGIPDDKKAAMLEPFVRGEDARTMDETTGFGLGLSIAQAIVTAHGGTLSLCDNPSNGLRVAVTLPRDGGQAIEPASNP